MLQVRNLTKVYAKGKVLANDQISLDVRQGEILAILGPNGAGKSTLIKQLVGHLRPTSGSISLLGRDAVREAEWIPTVTAYYPQRPLALQHLTVQEALCLTGRLRGLRTAEAQRQAEEIMAEFGLESRARHALRALSGGQQRLTGIGTALIGRLPLLVLDEPTNELDPAYRRKVWDIVRRRNREQATTVIVVTHNVLEAEQVVDRVAIIDHGRLLALDSVTALKRQVDNRMRLELAVDPTHFNETYPLLERVGLVQSLGDSRIRVTLDRLAVGEALQVVLDQPGIEEYKLLPPSLEDVYFHVGGKEVAVHG